MNASLPLERLACLACLRELAAQTLDTDSWGAEMDLARRPGDLWEPGVESYWTMAADDMHSDSSDDDSSRQMKNSKRSRGRGAGKRERETAGKPVTPQEIDTGESKPAAGSIAGWSAGKIAPGLTIRKGSIQDAEDAQNMWCDLPQTRADFEEKLMVLD